MDDSPVNDTCPKCNNSITWHYSKKELTATGKPNRCYLKWFSKCEGCLLARTVPYRPIPGVGQPHDSSGAHPQQGRPYAGFANPPAAPTVAPIFSRHEATAVPTQSNSASGIPWAEPQYGATPIPRSHDPGLVSSVLKEETAIALLASLHEVRELISDLKKTPITAQEAAAAASAQQQPAADAE